MATDQFMKLTRAQHAHIRVLFAQNGNQLSKEKLVTSAQDQDSPIHDLFTWDNRRAAHLYRLRQAARILRVYVAWIPLKKAKNPPQFGGRPMAFFVKPSEQKDRTWVEASNALEDEYMYQQVVAGRIQSVRTSMKQLLSVAALEPLYNKLEDVIRKFEIRYERRPHVRA